MKQILKKHKWLLLGTALAVLCALCAWIYGWGGGNIDMIDFDAEHVDRVQFGFTITDYLDGVTITEKEDIQTIIDSINSFRHTGNELKDFFKFGPFPGGTVLYEFVFYLSDGTEFVFCFGANSHRDLSDIEVSYWVYQQGHRNRISPTCRGSLEPFYELYEKYRGIES